MEYLAVVRLRTLIAQEAEVEQAKVRELTLKKAIHEPVATANEIDNQSENAHRALIKAGEIPALPRMPVQVSPQSKNPPKAKAIKAPILHESAAITWLSSFGWCHRAMCLASSSLWVRERLLWVNLLLVPWSAIPTHHRGVRDEAGIRGHRRTYVASGPGLLAQALRKAGRMEPVLLL